MNPLILKGIRERLRIKHLIASALFSLIITTTLYLSTYLNGMQERRHYDFATKQSSIIEENPINGARNAFTYLLGFQGFLLMFLGTGGVASVTAEEKERTIGLPADDTNESIFQNQRLPFWITSQRIFLCSFSPSPFCFIA